ncbi:unnamed protein product [Mytilus coruscus]|uniref:Uncharacterized protein n=1 Tax=Mytilus coruscus TaxID=42192 RepID=A0A6J8ER67_MYTCO|nr:unnamed protein product [Mytilus coruscus]
MAHVESWKKLTFLNKCLFVLTFVATFSLILGFATPFWLTVSVPEDFAAKVYNKPSKLQIDLLETDHYLGLWQWCFGGNGCIDLGLIAKFGFEKKYQYQWEKDSYEKVKKIIAYWIATRVFAAIGFISGVLVTIMLLWFICRGTNHCQGRTVIGCFVTGGFLVISVAVFGSGIYNNSDMFHLHRFEVYHHLSFSFGITCIAAIMYTVIGTVLTLMLCSGGYERRGRHRNVTKNEDA